MWSTVPLARYFVNSTIVATSATLASLVIAIFAAYAVSRYRFRGRSAFTTTVLSTQMFPGVLFLLPLFIIFVNLDQTVGIQLVGTRIGLIITYLTFSLPFSIWMLAGYFDGIPRELDEAARVDGCSPIGALLRVVLPAARPGVIAVAIYGFMTAWGEVLFASVMTTSANRTLAIGLRQYSTEDERLLERDHGRVARRQPARRDRLPAAAAVLRRGPHLRLDQVGPPPTRRGPRPPGPGPAPAAPLVGGGPSVPRGRRPGSPSGGAPGGRRGRPPPR